MKLNILGSGTILQKPLLRNCSGYLVDGHLLVDCGPGIWKALGNAGISANNIDAILISHFHIDHCGDFAAILMQRWLESKQQFPAIQVIGPKGLKDWFTILQNLNGNWLSEVKYDLREIGQGEIEINGYHIHAALTGHTGNSLCFRIEDSKGKRIYYSGDSDYKPALINHAFSVDLAIMECSNTTETKIPGHMTPELCGKFAAQAAVKKLCLAHLYPEVWEIDAVKIAAKNYKGNIFIAEDGMEITV